MTGERDIRSEDRQLLLDAIGAATEKLVITYTGANEYSGQRKPPAVPLAELLDTLDITTSEKVRDHVLIEHPLQPFDIRNVTPGALGMPTEPFTFDPTALIAAQVATGERGDRRDVHRPGRCRRPRRTTSPSTTCSASSMTRSRASSARWTTRCRGRSTASRTPCPSRSTPSQEWTVGDRMLSDMLRGMTPEEAQQAEWRRGTLPPGHLGWRKAQRDP